MWQISGCRRVHINFLVVRQRAGDDLVAALAQYGDGLRADQAGVLSQTLDEDEREYHFRGRMTP